MCNKFACCVADLQFCLAVREQAGRAGEEARETVRELRTELTVARTEQAELAVQLETSQAREAELGQQLEWERLQHKASADSLARQVARKYECANIKDEQLFLSRLSVRKRGPGGSSRW